MHILLASPYRITRYEPEFGSVRDMSEQRSQAFYEYDNPPMLGLCIGILDGIVEESEHPVTEGLRQLSPPDHRIPFG